MSFSTGAKLGPYEIVAPLGAGGMGEVWRAKDTRLDRDVAIKVLPEAMAGDKERLLRFEREARLLASLSHPNIAAIHGFEHLDGRHLLIMEFVDGPTLAQRLTSGPLPVDEGLDVGVKIAEALEAAHEKGVIHRDLKPANIKITPEGKVKVLDFGLAKALAEESGGSSVADSPTITANYTRPGVVLGTAPYMSPEQARGKSLDKRTDIWSFGCVLYEMLTGGRLFDGESSSDIIARILERDPDFSTLPPKVPPRVRELLKHALEKNPRRRLRDIGDAVLELEASVTNREWSTTAINVAATSSRGFGRRAAAIAALAATIALAAYAGWQWGGRSRPRGSGALAGNFVKLTDQQGIESHPALSPDGKMVVYVAFDGDDLDIFALRVGGLNPLNLTRDCAKDDTQPAFSPDGTRIVFRSERDSGGLFVMGATGESPRRLTDFGFDPKWSADGRHVAFATEGVFDPLSRNSTSLLWSVDVSSGEKKKLTETDAVQPCWSPHGLRIVYWSVWKKGGQRDIYSIPSSGGEPVALMDDPATDWCPVWSPDGRFIYFCSDRGGSMNIWRRAVDEQTGRPQGDCEPVTSGVTIFAQPSLTSDGRQMALTSVTLTANIERVGLNPKEGAVVGAPETVSRFTGILSYPDVSPDGEWIACVSADNLILLRSDGSERRQLTSDAYKDRGPSWSPDGKRLAFYSDRSGRYEIWTANPDGSNPTQLSHTTGRSVAFPQWSPDGKRLFFSNDDRIVIMDPNRPWAEQSAQVISTMEPPNAMTASSWSPDGKSFAGSIYDTESGSNEGIGVYTIETKSLRRIAEKGEFPKFLSDGRRLVFLRNDELMLVEIDGGAPRTLLSIAPDRLDTNGMSLPRDDSAIYYTRHRMEADVWLIELP
ncbi:MAG TPA: protein kinase [Phycisphaerae bacterium]|nr:protein kinase [Phycisphaerae bacterium]